jgi:hypothetical protein
MPYLPSTRRVAKLNKLPRGKTIIVALAAIALLAIRLHAGPASPRNHQASTAPPVPVLIELFTSEGCSSCPPADAYVEMLDKSQPLSGVHLIVLSEHVDYWDHDGWKDPYSSHALTDRQTDYGRALGLPTVYTPQIIVDGATILKGDAQQIKGIYAKAEQEPMVTVRIDSASVAPQSPPALRAHISVDGEGAKHDGEVFVALTLDHAESQITAGENNGKHLAYVSVVEELKKIGKLRKGKDFSQDVEFPLKPEIDPHNLRLISFVQQSGPGRVLGAAEDKLD